MNRSYESALYVIATPIGNLKDITLRALEVLKEASLIACEDTRTSGKLLHHYDIRAKTIAFHEHSDDYASQKIINEINNNKVVALISDAGTPLISDPGYELIRLCKEQNIKVIPIPGASSPIAALSVSGIATNRFTFLGFPPPQTSKRKTFYTEVKNRPETLIIFESPKRVIDSLQDLKEVMGERQIFVGREITKMHEEYLLISIDEAISNLQSRESIKGEFTIVISGKITEEETSITDIEQLIENMLKTMPVKEVAKTIAEDFNIPKKEAYKLALEKAGKWGS